MNSHTKPTRHRWVDAPWRGNTTLAARTISHLWPFTSTTYPGLRRGVQTSLDAPFTWQAVKHWMEGRTKIPVWAARALHDAHRRRGELDLQIASELDAYIRERSRELHHQNGRLKGRFAGD
jgi:hypothetical protein